MERGHIYLPVLSASRTQAKLKCRRRIVFYPPLRLSASTAASFSSEPTSTIGCPKARDFFTPLPPLCASCLAARWRLLLDGRDSGLVPHPSSHLVVPSLQSAWSPMDHLLADGSSFAVVEGLRPPTHSGHPPPSTSPSPTASTLKAPLPLPSLADMLAAPPTILPSPSPS